MDLWTTINPRRRRGKFLKTTKTRREAAEIFLETTRPRTENPAKKSLRGGLMVSPRFTVSVPLAVLVFDYLFQTAGR